jgi:putative oxidoreductase
MCGWRGTAMCCLCPKGTRRGDIVEGMTRILKTNSDLTPALLRLVLGIVFLPHGLQKVFGWFGGSGYSATMSTFENGMHIPAVFAFLAIAAEFLGAIGLIAGFLTRIAALGLIIEMLVAIFKVHRNNGFFMNWSGKQAGEGYEYHLLVIVVGVAIMILGAGAFSVDGMLYRRKVYWGD